MRRKTGDKGGKAMQNAGNDSPVLTLESSEKRLFLIECLKENLEHARHVENERLTFVSLLLVGVGLILEFAATITCAPLKIGLYVVLILINIICTCLLRRWEAIFEGHRAIAKELTSEIQKWLSKTPSSQYTGAKSEGTLYLFDTKLAYRILKQKKKEDKSNKSCHIHTSTYFYFFNALIYVIILVFFVNSVP